MIAERKMLRRCWYSRLTFCLILIIVYVWILMFSIPPIFTVKKSLMNRWKSHQRVITISLFGPKENSLFQWNTSFAFLEDFIRDAQIIYPGWIVRIYHDNFADVEHLTQLQNQYDFIALYNLTGEMYPPPRMWRFLSIGDTTVDISQLSSLMSRCVLFNRLIVLVLSRDLDSPLTDRERSAVDEWLLSNKIMHAMRDHPFHADLILAGMWGFRPSNNKALAHLIYMKLQNASLMGNYEEKADQLFLANEVWPLVKNDSIIHASFHCKRFQDNAHPFPTKRPSILGQNIFVGCVKPCNQSQFVFDSCPFACRPQNHKDWIYC